MENHKMNHKEELHEHMHHDMSQMKEHDKHTAEHEDNRHKGHSTENFKKRFFISLIITIPILILSSTIQNLLRFSFSFNGKEIIIAILASIVAIYGGMPFFIGAIREIKRKDLGMMVLVSLAVLSGYLYSLGTTFLFEAPDFYWEISTLTVFLLFGHWMEMKAIMSASGVLGELVKLIPKKANLIT